MKFTSMPTIQRGCTLLELVMVVAMIGLLAAIALPSYQEFIRKSSRAKARAVLFKAAQWLERSATHGQLSQQRSCSINPILF